MRLVILSALALSVCAAGAENLVLQVRTCANQCVTVTRANNYARIGGSMGSLAAPAEVKRQDRFVVDVLFSGQDLTKIIPFECRASGNQVECASAEKINLSFGAGNDPELAFAGEVKFGDMVFAAHRSSATIDGREVEVTLPINFRLRR